MDKPGKAKGPDCTPGKATTRQLQLRSPSPWTAYHHQNIPLVHPGGGQQHDLWYYQSSHNWQFSGVCVFCNRSTKKQAAHHHAAVCARVASTPGVAIGGGAGALSSQAPSAARVCGSEQNSPHQFRLLPGVRQTQVDGSCFRRPPGASTSGTGRCRPIIRPAAVAPVGDQFPYLIPLGTVLFHHHDHFPAAGIARLCAKVAEPLAGYWRLSGEYRLWKFRPQFRPRCLDRSCHRHRRLLSAVHQGCRRIGDLFGRRECIVAR